jgi:hypothetical protein
MGIKMKIIKRNDKWGLVNEYDREYFDENYNKRKW